MLSKSGMSSLMQFLAGEDLEFVKSLPAYKAAESYLNKRNLDFEKAKILYRRLRPSADEREFRRKCAAKFGHGGMAVLKPGCSLDSDFADFVAVFEVEGEKFNVVVLSQFFYDALITFQSNMAKKNFGKLAEFEEYENADGSKGVQLRIRAENLFSCFTLPDVGTPEEDIQRALKASDGIAFEIEVKYEEPDLRILASLKREKRLGFLAASELFLGPKAVWVNKNDFPS